MSASLADRLNAAAATLRARTGTAPRIGLILGSGLGPLADRIEGAASVPYGDVPHMPLSTAPGHAGRFVIGRLAGQRVIAMQGRVHLYEGHSAADVAFPVQLMASLGVERLVITNAAGGVNRGYAVGDLMVIADHVNLPGMAGNDPLRGPHDGALGPRFASLNNAYDRDLRAEALAAAKRLGIPVHSGVYAWLAGPTFETPAEIRLLARLGADAVGMSTVPEVIAARHRGLKVLAISAITNLSIHDTDSDAVTTEEEVWDSMAIIVPRLEALLLDVLAGWADD